MKRIRPDFLVIMPYSSNMTNFKVQPLKLSLDKVCKPYIRSLVNSACRNMSNKCANSNTFVRLRVGDKTESGKRTICRWVVLVSRCPFTSFCCSSPLKPLISPSRISTCSYKHTPVWGEKSTHRTKKWLVESEWLNPFSISVLLSVSRKRCQTGKP